MRTHTSQSLSAAAQAGQSGGNGFCTTDAAG